MDAFAEPEQCLVRAVRFAVDHPEVVADRAQQLLVFQLEENIVRFLEIDPGLCQVVRIHVDQPDVVERGSFAFAVMRLAGKPERLLVGLYGFVRLRNDVVNDPAPDKGKDLSFYETCLAGKLDGFAMRVPVLNVSVIDLTFTVQRETTVKEVNDLVRQAKSKILHINDDPLVSCDFNHNPASAIFDTTQTKVLGKLVKVVAWYDNEWGFSNRMLDTAQQMMNCKG